MLDYQRIIDDVHSALFDNGQNQEDFLQGVAADYSLAIDEANERLRQCGTLLRKGLRSEAIQLCEVEPNLLDVVQTLDLPERESWNELLSLNGLVTPPSLLLEVAANLNEAYSVDQPLAALLQRHRLLAMSRGPIKLRLETLRSLAEADPENAVWDQDVRTFEEERAKELERDVPQAIAGGDAATLSALSTELENSAWRIDRPEELIQQICAARAKVARQQGLGEMRQAADLLNAMHMAFDVDGGRRAREQWNGLFATWGRFADAALLQGAAPALDWLREQDELGEQAARHATAVADLEQAVSGGRPAAMLHRLYREAKREGDIPEEVEKRYRERLAATDRAARRRIQLSLGIFAVFILAVGAVVAMFVLQHMQASKVDRAFEALEQLDPDHNVDAARNFIDQLSAESPQIAADPRIQEINNRLVKRQKDEDSRRKAFAAAIELVQKSITDQLPDKEALARARKVAISEEENTAIRKAEQDIAKLEQDRTSKVDQDFLVQLKELKERVDAVEKEAEDKPEACAQKLGNLGIELTNLLTLNPHISEAAKQPAELLRSRLKSLDGETQSVNERITREEAIAAAVGDHAAFKQRLLDYAGKFPQARQSGSFRAVASDESPLWDWIDKWNEAVQLVGRQNCAKFDRKTAADVADKLRKLLADRCGHPDAEALRQRLPHMDAILRRIDGEGNPIEAALKPVFTDPLVAGVWMLTDTTGQKYYLLEDPAAKFGSLNALQPGRIYGFQYVTGFDLAKKPKSLRGDDIQPGRVIAPQRETAKALAGILERTTDDAWELSFCRMVDTVLHDHDTDPLLRHFLLRKILDVGCKGSLCLQNGFSRYLDFLKNSKIPRSVNWVDPDNSEAAERRPVAETELASLPSFADAQSSAAKEWKSLGESVGTELICVGWLRKTSAGNWQCLTKANCSESGRLVIVQLDSQKAKAAVFEAVGRLERGKAVIDAAPGPALAEGRPVFVTNPPPK